MSTSGRSFNSLYDTTPLRAGSAASRTSNSFHTAQEEFVRGMDHPGPKEDTQPSAGIHAARVSVHGDAQSAESGLPSLGAHPITPNLGARIWSTSRELPGMQARPDTPHEDTLPSTPSDVRHAVVYSPENLPNSTQVTRMRFYLPGSSRPASWETERFYAPLHNDWSPFSNVRPCHHQKRKKKPHHIKVAAWACYYPGSQADTLPVDGWPNLRPDFRRYDAAVPCTLCCVDADIRRMNPDIDPDDPYGKSFTDELGHCLCCIGDFGDPCSWAFEADKALDEAIREDWPKFAVQSEPVVADYWATHGYDHGQEEGMERIIHDLEAARASVRDSRVVVPRLSPSRPTNVIRYYLTHGTKEGKERALREAVEECVHPRKTMKNTYDERYGHCRARLRRWKYIVSTEMWTRSPSFGKGKGKIPIVINNYYTSEANGQGSTATTNATVVVHPRGTRSETGARTTNMTVPIRRTVGLTQGTRIFNQDDNVSRRGDGENSPDHEDSQEHDSLGSVSNRAMISPRGGNSSSGRSSEADEGGVGSRSEIHTRCQLGDERDYSRRAAETRTNMSRRDHQPHVKCVSQHVDSRAEHATATRTHRGRPDLRSDVRADLTEVIGRSTAEIIHGTSSP